MRCLNLLPKMAFRTTRTCFISTQLEAEVIDWHQVLGQNAIGYGQVRSTGWKSRTCFFWLASFPWTMVARAIMLPVQSYEIVRRETN